MELLARFELATPLHEILDFMESSRPRIEILTAYAVRADEAASSFRSEKPKKNPSKRMGFFLELLARFELATSSLPRMRSTD